MISYKMTVMTVMNSLTRKFLKEVKMILHLVQVEAGMEP